VISRNSITERVTNSTPGSLLARASRELPAFDIILFYVFFELTLVPSFPDPHLGGPERRTPPPSLFIYTLPAALSRSLGCLRLWSSATSGPITG